VEILMMAALLHQQGHDNLANLRRMASSTSSEVHLVHLLVSLREQPTGANDINNSDIIRIIMIVSEKQLRRMFQVSCHGFECARTLRLGPKVRL
jgi:hypothetical protein